MTNKDKPIQPPMPEGEHIKKLQRLGNEALDEALLRMSVTGISPALQDLWREVKERIAKDDNGK